jgi:hypothetical protein
MLESEPGNKKPSMIDENIIQAEALTLTLRPHTQTRAGTCRVRIELRNAHAEPAVVQLSVHQDLWIYRLGIQPRELRIPPHGQAAAWLIAKPFDELVPGEARRRTTFTVEAREEKSNQAVSGQGEFIQVRRSRLEVFGLLLGAIVLTLALGALVVGGGLHAVNSLGWFVTPNPGAVVIPTVTPTNTQSAPPTANQTLAATITPTTASPPLPSAEVQTTPLPPSPTPLPTVEATPTQAPTRPTRVIATTSTPTPSAAPGVYALALVADPPLPQNGQGVIFRVTFLNTTGSDQYYKWCVESFSDDGRSHGITSCRFRSTIPSGENQLATIDPYIGQKVGGCLPLRARVIWEDDAGRRNAFAAPDGSPVWLAYQFCPA